MNKPIDYTSRIDFTSLNVNDYIRFLNDFSDAVSKQDTVNIDVRNKIDKCLRVFKYDSLVTRVVRTNIEDFEYLARYYVSENAKKGHNELTSILGGVNEFEERLQSLGFESKLDLVLPNLNSTSKDYWLDLERGYNKNPFVMQTFLYDYLHGVLQLLFCLLVHVTKLKGSMDTGMEFLKVNEKLTTIKMARVESVSINFGV